MAIFAEAGGAELQYEENECVAVGDTSDGKMHSRTMQIPMITTFGHKQSVSRVEQIR